jgi:hypothetical protein
MWPHEKGGGGGEMMMADNPVPYQNLPAARIKVIFLLRLLQKDQLVVRQAHHERKLQVKSRGIPVHPELVEGFCKSLYCNSYFMA